MTGQGLLAFVRWYVITMRPYLLFVSGITGILGLALGPAIGLSSALLAGSAFFLSYGFGQALTDCFQLDTDSLSAPYRPLVQGRLSRRQVLVVSLAGLLFCGALLIRLHPLNALFAGLTVFGLATYTFFKRRWWSGPFYNAWIVALLVVMGYLAAVGADAAPGVQRLLLGWPTGLTGALIVAFFGYANFVLSGYYKDISADRATGYRTLPVRFGLRPSAVVSDGFAVLALAGVLVAGVPQLPGWTWSMLPAVAFVAAGSVAATAAQIRLHRVRDEGDAHVAIVPAVHAYVLWLAGLATLYQPDWAPALLVLYAAFAVTMARRPETEQI
ncbi:MAG: UbiA family prenyltransferase [Gemmatimonadetes bacterium]|nr:UbiA family prenyltransferase [Gemmatimonadota bacterium]